MGVNWAHVAHGSLPCGALVNMQLSFGLENRRGISSVFKQLSAPREVVYIIQLVAD